MLFSLQSLLVFLLVLTAMAVGFVLQDLPLERFERSTLDWAPAFERQARANMLFRPYLGQYSKIWFNGSNNPIKTLIKKLYKQLKENN